MKLLHKLVLSAVALTTLSLATPAQAFWGRGHAVVVRGRVVYGYPGYYGYYGPSYYTPSYYGYYGPYYGPYYGGGVSFAFGGHGYYRGGGFRGGFGHGGSGHGGHR